MNFVAEVELENTTAVLLVVDATDTTDAANRAWAWFEKDGEAPVEARAFKASAKDEERLAGLAI
jgi:hypothetical protein